MCSWDLREQDLRFKVRAAIMDGSGSREANQKYYDAFSRNYERRRGDNDPGGYHELLDELETGYVRQFGEGKDILEVGCGTGLLLDRIRRFAGSCRGVDLSPGMLEKARERGLDVTEGSATALPFDNESFDVTCSFKVLAHIPQIAQVLSEMARVTRPSGVILAEFYNPNSFRGLAKKWLPARPIAEGTTETAVYTRFDSPARARELVPSGCSWVGARGIRIVTPVAAVMTIPILRNVLRFAEERLCDSRLAAFGGFYVATYRKNPRA